MKKLFATALALGLFSATISTQASVIGPAVHATESVAHMAENPYAWHAGAATTIVNGIYKDSKGFTLVYPYVGYRGDRLTIAGPSGWLRLAGPQELHVSLGGTLLPDSFDPHRSTDAKMRLLNKRDFSVGLGLQGSMMIKSLGLLNVRLLRSFIGGDGGYFMDASYTGVISRGFGGVSLSLIPTAGIQYFSDKLANYYYGVSNAEAAKSGISAYTAGSDYQPYIGLGLMGEVKGRLRAFVSTKMAYLPDSVAHSPMVNKRYMFTTTLVLSYGL